MQNAKAEKSSLEVNTKPLLTSRVTSLSYSNSTAAEFTYTYTSTEMTRFEFLPGWNRIFFSSDQILGTVI